MATLNEGRSVNPGYTGLPRGISQHRDLRSTKAGASTPATHPRGRESVGRRNRSTKAGASTPATRSVRCIRGVLHGSAQRRPERQPRLHTHPPLGSQLETYTLNEGRSVNPGYTRHSRAGSGDGVGRSTKAGASTPATRTTAGGSCLVHRPLNEGRSVNPGYTCCSLARQKKDNTAQRRPERQPRLHSFMRHKASSQFAQRRPERQPRLHVSLLNFLATVQIRSTKAGASTPATHTTVEPRQSSGSLNEGRSVNPGYTRINDDGLRSRRRRSTKAGASTPATPCETNEMTGADRSTKAGASTATLSTARCPPAAASLNEGRSVNPGYTSAAGLRTKAGASTPRLRVGCTTLNEGRSVNPGYTAKFCKRAVSGQTIARPRAREPRRRRVCGHFTRFWTIPRQNGQDQALRLP